MEFPCGHSEVLPGGCGPWHISLVGLHQEACLGNEISMIAPGTESTSQVYRPLKRSECAIGAEKALFSDTIFQNGVCGESVLFSFILLLVLSKV